MSDFDLIKEISHTMEEEKLDALKLNMVEASRFLLRALKWSDYSCEANFTDEFVLDVILRLRKKDGTPVKDSEIIS